MIKVVRLIVWGNLGGNIITAEIEISIKLTGFFYLFIYFFLICQFMKKIIIEL